MTVLAAFLLTAALIAALKGNVPWALAGFMAALLLLSPTVFLVLLLVGVGVVLSEQSPLNAMQFHESVLDAVDRVLSWDLPDTGAARRAIDRGRSAGRRRLTPRPPHTAAASSCIFSSTRRSTMTCTCCQPLSTDQRIAYPAATLRGGLPVPRRARHLHVRPDTLVGLHRRVLGVLRAEQRRLLLRITEAMTTDSAVVRYPIRCLIGESSHGQDSRGDAQAGARGKVDAFGQDARRSSPVCGCGAADCLHMEGPAG